MSVKKGSLKMSKRAKFDESGDSDELQALFDSIASEPAVRSVAPARPAALPTMETTGDSDELQALFDAVAAQHAAAEPGLATAPPTPASARPWARPAGPRAAPADAAPADAASDAVFNRIGQLTRQVHDTLRELGLDGALRDVAEVMPDARERLGYIVHMTEKAASRVLNATDIARPLQEGVEADARALRARWDRLFEGRLSADEFKVLSADTRVFIGEVAESSRETNAQLLEIMMAQDFQDLTGQVIKKVLDMAQTLETQLLRVLLEVAPADRRREHHAGLMNGPVVNGKGRSDVVTSQEQVDELLESLGF